MITQLFKTYNLFRLRPLWYGAPTHARMVRPITITIGSITAALHAAALTFRLNGV
jgi:hypothetical protein